MQRADIELAQWRAQVFGQTLHDPLVFQAQNEIAGIAFEASADDAMFFGRGFERLEKRSLALRRLRMLLDIKIRLQRLFQFEKRLMRVTAHETMRRQDDDVVVVHIREVSHDVIESRTAVRLLRLPPRI